MYPLSPRLLLEAYAQGMFPMAASADAEELHWFCPEWRGVLPLEDFHVPRSLKRFMAKEPFEVRFDTAFVEVMQGCAERDSTWINDEIFEMYTRLFEMGHAHSVECWEVQMASPVILSEAKDLKDPSVAALHQDDNYEKKEQLVGGLYGVSLGSAFFGESMFSRVSNASKVALVFLVERLRKGGYTLLDTQFINEHLKQFGCVEIPRGDYLDTLRDAVERSAVFSE